MNWTRRSLVSIAFLGSLSIASPRLSAAEWVPDKSLQNPDQHKRLYDIGRQYLDANFDSDADLVGTNSKHPPNKKQHATRESADYAYALLLTGDPAERDLAQLVLKKVMMTQDASSDGLTKGAFGWVWEDKPTDLNSADFVGTTLARIIDLDRHHPCLDPDVRPLVENSLRLSVLASMHRDADPGYTNIALLTVALTAAGDKLLHMPVAAAFSEAKLDAIMKMAGDDEYAEYLSPTYGAVDMLGAYLAKEFAFSDTFAAKTDATIDHLWKQFALSYHAPTDQLLGPFCRSYGENMLEYAAGLKYMIYLGTGGDYPLPNKERDHDWDKGGLVTVCDLPITPQDAFKQPQPATREFDSAGQFGVRHLTQYREGNFALGTIATQDEWKQKRNLVAYWRNDDAAAPNGFNVGFCLDESNETNPGGVNPAHIHFYAQQKKGTALINLVTDKAVPPDPACMQLVFDPKATLAGEPNANPLCIKDGSISTYVYSISNSPVTYQTAVDPKMFHITRSWKTADEVGKLHVMSYIIAFRPSDQPAPVIDNASVHADGDGGISSVKVDGVDFSASFKE